MRRRIAYCVTAAMWILAVVLLIQREIAPALALRAERKVTFKDYVSRLDLPHEERMGIYFLDKRVGELSTLVEQQPAGWLSVETKANVASSVPFSDLFSLNLVSQVLFDEDYQLSSVDFQLRGAGMQASIQGLVQNSVLNLRIKSNGTTTQKSIPIDPEALIADSLFPFAGAPDLRVGAEWWTTVVNPLTMSLDRAKVSVVEETEEVVDGKTEKVYVVATEYMGQQVRSWVTSSGLLLRQESPLGVRMVREAS